ncbi:MAG: NUDIX hydrolase [Candidatus Magasanikbacteria bacterium]|nr:NUDIX hydrolase [Candidatus Magasanikbacteria bacterium]
MQKIIVASGPVIVEDGKVLVSKHGDTSFWKFCGGKVEDYEENLFTTAKRRAKEEVGVDLELINEVPFFFYTQKEVDGGIADVILCQFLAKRIGEVKMGIDIREVAWLEVNNLPQDLAPNIIPSLKHFGFIE